MLNSDTLEIILGSAIVNGVAFLISSYLIFVKKRVPIYHLMALYHLYFFVGYVLRPFELYAIGFSSTWHYVGFTPDAAILVASAVEIVLAHFTMVAGFLYVNRSPFAVKPFPPFEMVPRKPISYALICFVFGCLGAYSSSLQLNSLDYMGATLSYDFAVDDKGGHRLMNISGYQLMFTEWIPVALVGLFMWRRIRAVAILGAIAFFGFRLVLGHDRQKFIFIAISFAIVYLIEQRRRFPTVGMVLIAAGLLFVFNLLGDDRLGFRRVFFGDMTLSEFVDRSGRIGDGTIAKNMAEYDTYTAHRSVIPDKTGYSFGSQYLRLFVWPIPRSFWPDKPVYTTVFNLNQFGNYRTLTSTLFMDSFMNSGVVVMVIVLFGVSCLLNLFYLHVVQNFTPANLVFYISVAMLSPLIFRDGLVSPIFNISVAWVGVAILFKLSGGVKMYSGTNSSIGAVPTIGPSSRQGRPVPKGSSDEA